MEHPTKPHTHKLVKRQSPAKPRTMSASKTEGFTMKIDLSLTNELLYQGCAIEVVAGRANLTTPIAEAIEIVGANIAALVAAVPASERGTAVLTGPMAVWAYLVVFRTVANTFGEVVYDDGRGQPVVVARRG